MRVFGVLAALALATPALAQQLALIAAPKYDPAPWWMDQPIMAAVGNVEAEMPANRASFSATFEAVEKTAPQATAAATAKMRSLGQALGALGADKVRTQVNLSIQPLYEQYRDREGNRIDNQRADAIESYQARATINVDVRDLALLQQVFAQVVAAQPSSTSNLSFRLEPTNEQKTALAREAMTDANRRAREASTATGARLGAVKLIDPTGRACQTDVLVAGAPRSFGPGVEVMSRSDFAGAPPPPPPPPPSAPAPGRGGGQTVAELAAGLPVQPPFLKQYAQSCVIYALAG